MEERIANTKYCNSMTKESVCRDEWTWEWACVGAFSAQNLATRRLSKRNAVSSASMLSLQAGAALAPHSSSLYGTRVLGGPRSSGAVKLTGWKLLPMGGIDLEATGQVGWLVVRSRLKRLQMLSAPAVCLTTA